MWYIKCVWTLVAVVALFSMVTGSCLEYGHSCWGAHGKRSGSKALIDAKQQTGPNSYAIDNLAEQLYNNNNQNTDDNDNDNLDISNSNNNSNIRNVPLAAPALAAPERNRNGLKWTQIMRQHRYRMRQLQEQQQQQGRGRKGLRGGYDAAAESWRKLQQALQSQLEAENEMSPGEPQLYELKK